MVYNYSSIKEIDPETLEYLEFVAPFDLADEPVTTINRFLTRVDECYDELDGETVDS